MTNFAAQGIYSNAKEQIINGGLSLDDTVPGAITIKCMLLKTTPTNAIIIEATVLTGFERWAGAGYVDITMNTAVTDAGNYGKFDSTDTTFTAVAADGGNQVVGCVIYKYNTNDADSIPIAYIPLTATTPDGKDIIVVWSGTGIINMTGGITSTT
jgi:hypothetical protein